MAPRRPQDFRLGTKLKRSNSSFAWILLAGALLTASYGATAQPNGDRPSRRGPPPEAISACKSLSEGDACSFSGRRGDESGQCITTPQDELACAPEGHESQRNNKQR
ncbi:MAG: hypothetical protein ACSHXK_06005 [Oceanococcus sp.]